MDRIFLWSSHTNLSNMKRKRLTREERRDETRERLLAAARTKFIENGYAETSVEDISLEAGYTRGAFYSNFGGKSELLLELVRRDHDVTHADFLSILKGCRTPTEMQARVLAYYSQLLRDDDSFSLRVEARLLARRDARLRERLDAFAEQRLDQVVAVIRALSERVGTPLPLPAKTLALVLVSLCEGAQLFQLGDSPQSADAISEIVLAGLLRRLMSR